MIIPGSAPGGGGTSGITTNGSHVHDILNTFALLLCFIILFFILFLSTFYVCVWGGGEGGGGGVVKYSKVW